MREGKVGGVVVGWSTTCSKLLLPRQKVVLHKPVEQKPALSTPSMQSMQGPYNAGDARAHLPALHVAANQLPGVLKHGPVLPLLLHKQRLHCLVALLSGKGREEEEAVINATVSTCGGDAQQ